MAQFLANVEVSSSTFATWLQRTNQLLNIVSTSAVTANSTLGVTTGNAFVDGTLSSNTLVAPTLRGGNNSTSNTLTLTSNVIANGEFVAAKSLTVTGNTTLGNVTFTSANGTTLTIGTSVVNTSAIISGNTTVTNSGITIGNVTLNTSAISVDGQVLNSSSIGSISNNSNYLDGHTWAAPKVIGEGTANSGVFTTITVDKLVANGSLGSNGQIVMANSTGGIYFTSGGAGGNGYTGSQGVIGFTGSAGPAGANGASGSDGPRGYTGSQGTSGGDGPRGYTGSAGAANSTPSFSALGVGTTAGTSGSIRATGDITAFYSDDRLKNKLGNIPNALEKVLSLNGFYYNPNEIAQNFGYKNRREVGVSAQEVERILPEIVTEAPIDPEYKTIWYDRLIPLLIEAIKELAYKVESN